MPTPDAKVVKQVVVAELRYFHSGHFVSTSSPTQSPMDD
jgi:hypothetical protein